MKPLAPHSSNLAPYCCFHSGNLGASDRNGLILCRLRSVVVKVKGVEQSGHSINILPDENGFGLHGPILNMLQHGERRAIHMSAALFSPLRPVTLYSCIICRGHSDRSWLDQGYFHPKISTHPPVSHGGDDGRRQPSVVVEGKKVEILLSQDMNGLAALDVRSLLLCCYSATFADVCPVWRRGAEYRWNVRWKQKRSWLPRLPCLVYKNAEKRGEKWGHGSTCFVNHARRADQQRLKRRRRSNFRPSLTKPTGLIRIRMPLSNQTTTTSTTKNSFHHHSY